MVLKKLIAEVEELTNEPFDIKNRRHFLRLNSKIERLHKEELRKYYLILKALKSTNNENEIFNSKTHYARTR